MTTYNERHIENLKDFGQDIIANSTQAIAKSFSSENRNGTSSFLFGSVACSLCLKMVSYNIVPVATIAVCTVCTCFIGRATYKATKEVIKNPLKGLP